MRYQGTRRLRRAARRARAGVRREGRSRPSGDAAGRPAPALVHVLDRVADGPKPRRAAALGAGYSTGSVRDACAQAEPDIVMECTGAPDVVVEAIQTTAPGAVMCLTGVSPRGRTLRVDVGTLNDELVLENDVVLGSVNANRRQFAAAAQALARADREWLEGQLIRDALEENPDIEHLSTYVEDTEEVEWVLEWAYGATSPRRSSPIAGRR